jgi:signal peptidase I
MMIRCVLIQGRSMAPYLLDGDMVVITTPKRNPQPGDIAIYRAPGHNFLVAHRVEAIRGGVAITRGDANTTPDPFEVTPGQIVGLVRLKIRWLGRLVARLKRRI